MSGKVNLIDNKYLFGVKSVVGDARRPYEDRAKVLKLETAAGLSLVVGIVADGVGSADNGGLAAQMSIDTIVAYMQQSQETNIPKLIGKAIKAANRAVFRDVMNRNVDASTTIVVCVIYEERVFIGNVGDSRAYWIQESGKMLQLSRDHSFYNIYGGDPNSDEAEMLVNAIGLKEDVYVDIGFYVQGPDPEKAAKIGKGGLPPQDGRVYPALFRWTN